MYSGFGIAFDGKNEWSFGDGYRKNVVTFGVDNSASSHADNLKNIFLMFGEGDTFDINGSFDALEKMFSINFSKKKPRSFAWVYIITLKIVICLLMEKKSLSLKPTIAMLTFQLSFFLEAYFMDLVLLSLEKYLWMEMCMIV